jgi:hypothetical protein
LTVSHRNTAANFERVLRNGGSHSFEITTDEMPELELTPGIDEGVHIPCRPLPGTNVWAKIVSLVAAQGGRCFYTRIAKGLYRVDCDIPNPTLRQS